jgi:5-methylcytosine-specific restriction endonuclease McrA
MDRASLEGFLKQGLSLEQIGRQVGRHPSTVGYWLKKHGLRAVNHDRHTPRGGVERHELETLVDSGATIAAMAAALGVGRSTVNYWLRKHGLRPIGDHRRRERRQAREAGLKTAKMTCSRHGVTDFWLEGRGYHRCLRCRAENIARHRRRVKARLVEEAGGSCVICGYNRYNGALQFHHRNPAEKEFNPSFRGLTPSMSRLRAEARKCVLLCSNCHAEVEAGVVSLPA